MVNEHSKVCNYFEGNALRDTLGNPNEVSTSTSHKTPLPGTAVHFGDGPSEGGRDVSENMTTALGTSSKNAYSSK